MQSKSVALVSACILGVPCRYDGKLPKNVLTNELIKKLKKRFVLIPVCPEQLSGFSTPRNCIEIKGGDGFDVLDKKVAVKNNTGQDVTNFVINGAYHTLKIARLTDAKFMITQKRSPTCSAKKVYDGSFKGILIDGYGVTAALLKRNGLELIDYDELMLV